MRLAGQLVSQYEAVMLPRSSASVILMMRLIIADPCSSAALRASRHSCSRLAASSRKQRRAVQLTCRWLLLPAAKPGSENIGASPVADVTATSSVQTEPVDNDNAVVICELLFFWQ